MRLLLDTHVFLWYITNDPRLHGEIAASIQDPSSEVFLSVVSTWEILIKYQIGRLDLPAPVDAYLRQRQNQHRIVTLALENEAVAHLLSLPALHRDPFDRMLICQAIHHELTLVTADAQIERYPVPCLRAD